MYFVWSPYTVHEYILWALYDMTGARTSYDSESVS